MTTHEVRNQVPPLVDHNTADYPALREALARAGASDAFDEIDAVGVAAGTAHAFELGDRAEDHPPVLHTHDRYGHRIDEVVYDPAYHELMRTAVRFGLHGAAWQDRRPHAHLIRAAKFSLWQAVDAGHGCPIAMTYAVVPTLRVDPDQAARYEALLCNDVYDPGLREPTAKAGLIAGMSMTEKQGGSDVRANTTTATPLDDGTYRIVGHKWFTSAPMSDILLTLAQAPGGLTCFVLPRVLPDGSRNGIRLQRLKNKLGNRSNASSEIEYDDALGWRLGEEGRGVPTIIEMVNGTRLDCTLGTATLMRQGVQQAAHHASYRAAFGRTLIDQPLMRNVLADLAVEAEAATTVALWLASLTDAAEAGDERAGLLRRIGLAATKYHVCKRGPIHVAEALECLGGNGYIEDSRMPRLFREAPLASIWEGSGNVAALDALRAAAKHPDTLVALFDELDTAAGADDRLDRFVAATRAGFDDLATLEFRARRVVGDLAIALQASLLVRQGHPAVADAFVGSRLTDDRRSVLGTLAPGVDTTAILERSVPRVGKLGVLGVFPIVGRTRIDDGGHVPPDPPPPPVPPTGNPTRRRTAPVAVGASFALVLAAPIVTWFLLGPLDESAPGTDPDLYPDAYDYLYRPPDIDPTIERAIGIFATFAAILTLATLVAATRRRRFDRRWWPPLVGFIVAGVAIGFGARVLTAAVVGANIGGGMVLLFGTPAVGGLTIVSALWAVHVARSTTLESPESGKSH